MAQQILLQPRAPFNLVDAQRFFDKMIPEPMSGCWLWLGGIMGKGYAAFHCQGFIKGNRVSYAMFNGALTSADLVRHKCDTPCCVNPDHLIIGSYINNHQDMVDRGRAAWQRNPAAWSASVSRSHRNVAYDWSRGDKHAMAKLSWAQVDEIRTDTVTKTKELAAKYMVSRQTIQGIRNGINWRLK